MDGTPAFEFVANVKWTSTGINDAVSEAKRAIARLAQTKNAGLTESVEISRTAVQAQRSIRAAKDAGVITAKMARDYKEDLTDYITKLWENASGEVKRGLGAVRTSRKRERSGDFPGEGPFLSKRMQQDVDAQRRNAERAFKRRQDDEEGRRAQDVLKQRRAAERASVEEQRRLKKEAEQAAKDAKAEERRQKRIIPHDPAETAFQAQVQATNQLNQARRSAALRATYNARPAVEGAIAEKGMKAQRQMAEVDLTTFAERDLQAAGAAAAALSEALNLTRTRDLADYQQAMRLNAESLLDFNNVLKRVQSADVNYIEAMGEAARLQERANNQRLLASKGISGGQLAGMSDQEIREQASAQRQVDQLRERALRAARVVADPTIRAAAVDKEIAERRARDVAGAGAARAVAADPGLAAERRTALEQERAAVTSTMAADDLYIEARTTAAGALQSVAASVSRALLADDDYIRATAILADNREHLAARAFLESREISHAGLDRTQLQAAVTAQKQIEHNARQAGAVGAGGAALVSSEVERAGARAGLAANVARESAARDEVVGALADEKVAVEHLTDKVYLQAQGIRAEDLQASEDRLRADLARRSDAERRKALMATQAGEAEIKASVDRRVAEAGLNSAIRVREKELIKAAIREGEFGGTRFQRLQAVLSPGAVKTPDQFATVGQFAGQKALQTLGYGISGAAIGAVTIGLTAAVKSASEFEQSLIRLRAQLTNMGKGDQFEGVQQQIRAISVETGTSAVDVAAITQRFLSTYKNDADGIAKAMADTGAAMKIMQVTGTDMATTLSSVEPLMKSFGVTATQVGDAVTEMSQRTGRGADELLEVLGGAAVVSADAGASFEQLTIVTASMAAQLESTGQLGDFFSKLPQQIHNNFREISDVLRSAPDIAEEYLKPFQEAVGRGDEFQALMVLQRASLVPQAQGGLDAAARTNLARNIGTPRQQEEATAVFTTAKAAQEQIAKGLQPGALARQYETFGKTVEGAVDRVTSAFNDLGKSLYDSGLSEIFVHAANAAGGLIKAVQTLINMFAQVNNVTKIGPFSGGLLAAGAEALAAYYALRKVIEIVSAVRTKHAQKIAQETAAEAAGTGVRTKAAASYMQDKAGGRFVKDRHGFYVRGGEPAAADLSGLNYPRYRGESMRLSTGTRIAKVNLTAASGAFTQRYVQFSEQFDRQLQQAAGEAVRIGTPEAERKAQQFARRRRLGGLFAGSSTRLGQRVGANFGADPRIDPVTGKAPGLAAVAGSFGGSLVTAAGIAAVGAAHNRAKGEVQTAADALSEQWKKKSYEELAAMSIERSNLLQQIQGKLFNVDMPDVLRQKLLEEKAKATPRPGTLLATGATASGKAPDFARLMNDEQLNQVQEFLRQNRGFATDQLGLKLTDITQQVPYGGEAGGTYPVLTQELQITREDIPGILERLKDNRGEQAEALKDLFKRIYDGSANFAEVRSEIDRAVVAADRSAQAAIAGGLAELEQFDVAAIKARHDAGVTDVGQYIAELQEYRKKIVEDLNVEKDQAKKNQITVELGNLDRDTNSALDGVVKNALNLATKIAELRGAGPDQILALMRAAFAKLRSQSERDAMLPSLIDAEFAAFQSELNKIADPAELQRRISEGFQPSSAVTAGIVGQEISATPGGTLFTEQVGSWLGTAGDNVREFIANAVASSDKGTVDVVLAMLEKRRQAALADAGPEAESTKHLAEMQRQAVDVFSPGTGTALVEASFFFGKTGDEMKDWVIRMAAEQDKTIVQVMLELLQKRLDDEIAKVTEAGGDIASNPLIKDLQGKMDAWRQRQATSASAASGAAAGLAGPTRAGAEMVANLAKSRTALASAGSVADLQKERDAVADAQADLIAEEALIGTKDEDVKRRNEAQARLSRAQADLARADQAIKDIARGWAHVWANGDPVKETAAAISDLVADIERAEAEGRGGDAEKGRQDLQRAMFQADDNQNDIVRSRISILAATHERDPVQAARDALQLAENAVANAKGDAAKNEAEAARIRTQHGLEDAISNSISAKTDLAIAIANAADHPVEAARLAAQDAQRKLDEAIARGATENELSPLRTANVNAQAAFAQSQFAEEKEAIDFAAEMGQITVAQQIDAYRRMLATTEVGTSRYRDLIRGINSLTKQANADLQFNLPDVLQLPTAYEARRVNQSSMQGIGYQDNRNVNVSVVVNGAQNTTAVAAQVVGAIQSAMTRAPVLSAGVGSVG